MAKPVIIVGAGLSGLACARTLQARGIETRVIERSSAVGGRVQTDAVEGFLLDRGFQTLLTSYPEAQRQLDMNALDLRPFDPGAVLWNGDDFETIGDPMRDLGALFPTLLARAATLRDKLEVLRLRRDVLRGDDYDAFESDDVPTLAYLRGRGFSEGFIAQFFRPFLGGVFLEPELATTARFFRFVFRMFSSGSATVPARGMGQIPAQLAEGLADGTLMLDTHVSSVSPDGVQLQSGRRLDAAAVVVATEAPAAAPLVPSAPVVGSRAVTCVYFAAEQAPTSRAALHLNASGRGVINNMHVASAVSPEVAPDGQHLISVSCLGAHEDALALRDRVQDEARRWFGDDASRWSALRHYVIRHALPAQPPGALEPPRRSVRSSSGVYLCGDYLDQASIDGALVSGRRTAEALAADLRVAATG
ncbi:MAG: protoporphyrinogen/coproporphyrinogen oxidase [Nannocystaceae bacterium]|nr:FAD-dependent oxidoreductase [bacterium]